MEKSDTEIEATHKHYLLRGRLIPGVVWLILFVEFCERIAYYSISANLLLLCQSEFKLNSTDSATVVLTFTGASYCFPLLGSWIADTYSGKFNSVLFSCLCYLTGACLIPVSTYHDYDLSRMFRTLFFGLGLFFISLGSGGLKSNISTFGAEQVSKMGEKSIRSFFNWFYWIINLSSVISFTFIAYLQIYSFFYGFLPALSVMVLAVIILSIGRNVYICVPPNGSQLSDIVCIVYYSFKRMTNHRKTVKAELPVGSTLDLLDYAHISFGGKYTSDQIDVVRCVARIGLMFISMILFWTVYFQMPSSFLLQGIYMDLRLHDFTIPATSLNLFDIIVILLLIQFMEHCIYPLCNRFHWNFTPLRRMGLGMLLAVLSMVAAGLTEIYRKQHLTNPIYNVVSERTYKASSVTIFLQAPQYVLIGFSEVYTSIAGLEFAYSQSPRFLQSVVMSLFLAASGIGAFVGSIIIGIVSKYSNWFCNDINSCKLEYYFFLLAGILFLNLIVFISIAVKYSYVEHFVFGSSPVQHRKSRESIFEHSKNSNESWDRRSPAVSEGHI